MTFRLLGVVSQKHQQNSLLMDTTCIGSLSQQRRICMSKTLQELLDEATPALETVLWQILDEIEDN
jgi:hypothetical protein